MKSSTSASLGVAAAVVTLFACGAVGHSARLSVADASFSAPADLPVAPAGLGFYNPPANLVPGAHGSVIWMRPITGDPGIPGARNYLVLYRSVNLEGKTVPVSGIVAVPTGQVPKGGWPLISWAHGTAGVADLCAPSRDTGPSYLDRDYSSLTRAMQTKWVAAGYAMAQTDYQGLGTPGGHGYLIGEAEQRAVADMALAAREVAPAIGTRWVTMGHSQGGHAAVFANAESQQWVPQLQLLGSVAMAPASHLGLGIQSSIVADRIGALPAIGATPLAAGSASFLPLMIRGAQTVADINPAQFLTPHAQAMLSQADNRCIDQLREQNSWGGLRADQVYSRNADARALIDVINANEPSNLRFTLPLLVVQGLSDQTVAPEATVAMVAQQRLTGLPVESRYYPGVDHRGLLDASYNDVSSWVNARFGR